MFFKYARKTMNFRILRGKMRQNVIFCVQNIFKIVLFRKIFLFKIVFFIKKIFFKIVLFKYARNLQNLLSLRGKMRQNVIFCVQFFFEIMLFENLFLLEI